MEPDARRRFARQLLLADVGERGQARLCAHAVRVEGDERAAETARLYLERAGVMAARDQSSASAGGGDAGHVVEVASRESIRALAGRAELETAAAFLAGAFAAVEEIKRALAVGRAGDLEGASLIGPEDA